MMLLEDKDLILNGMRPLLSELRGARLFLTGGTGFFGKWILESIVSANDLLNGEISATVLSRDPAGFLQSMPQFQGRKELTFVRGDVVDFTLPPEPFTHFIHAATAASAALASENPLLMVDTVVAGTRRTLDYARACGAKKFLFTSSGAVYGAQSPQLERVGEDCLLGPDVTQPSLCYHEAKRLAEMLCCIYAKNSPLEMKIARCFAFVGPHLPLHTHFAIGNFIADGLAGRAISVGGDGTPLRSYLYAADLVVWLWTILVQGRNAVPYNVGSPRAVSIAALADIVSKSFSPADLEVRVARTPEPDRPAARYVPDVSRAQEELGLRISVELEEGLARTIAWHRAHRAIPATAT